MINMERDYTDPRRSSAARAATIAELGLSITSKFVPFSQSRNANEKHKSLNWRVTLCHARRKGLGFYALDYSAGIGHAPSYRARQTQAVHECVVMECEKGFECRWWNGRVAPCTSRPILPDPLDVWYAVASEIDVIDYRGFEDWANTFGYDSDSRSAEKIYRTCLETALAIRSEIGEQGVEKLRRIMEGY